VTFDRGDPATALHQAAPAASPGRAALGPSGTAVEGSAARPEPVPWLASLTPATHGAYHSPRDRPDGVLDFSANGNVIGPPPGTADAIAGVDVTRYPDPTAHDLRAAIATREGIPADCVVAGNGSTELIWAVARAYLGPGRTALVCGPTYGEYAVASAATGASVQIAPLLWPDGRGEARDPAEFAAGLARCAHESDARMIWLCHPNNPTGEALPVRRLGEVMRAAPEALIVVDEAYLLLTDGLPSALTGIESGRLAVLRSMTKDAALAGIRVGALLAAPEVVEIVRRVVPPWSVSSVAQAAGCHAVADVAHLRRARAAVAASRDHLVDGLRRRGLAPRPSVANFVLVEVGNGRLVAERLLERGLAVRDCASFGLPAHVRIGVRSIPDQERLLAALPDALARTGDPIHLRSGQA